MHGIRTQGTRVLAHPDAKARVLGVFFCSRVSPPRATAREGYVKPKESAKLEKRRRQGSK
jgi:hypothetical protein